MERKWKTNLDSRCLTIIYSCYYPQPNRIKIPEVFGSFCSLMFTGMKQSSQLVGIYQWLTIVNKDRKSLVFTTFHYFENQ